MLSFLSWLSNGREGVNSLRPRDTRPSAICSQCAQLMIVLVFGPHRQGPPDRAHSERQAALSWGCLGLSSLRPIFPPLRRCTCRQRASIHGHECVTSDIHADSNQWHEGQTISQGPGAWCFVLVALARAVLILLLCLRAGEQENVFGEACTLVVVDQSRVVAAEGDQNIVLARGSRLDTSPPRPGPASAAQLSCGQTIV